MPILIVTHKQCTVCREDKPIEEFYWHSRKNRNPNYDSLCKKCHCSKTEKWAKENVEARRAIARNWVNRHADTTNARVREKRKQNKEWNAAMHLAYQTKYPEKKSAQVSVMIEKRAGRLIQGVCQDCGDPKTEAHHADYSKPLDVTWLCHRCHMKRHRKQKSRVDI